jgi:hypothetical protein
MGKSQIVENVRRLIASHAAHDESVFQKAAETIIQELGVANRPGEALGCLPHRSTATALFPSRDPNPPAMSPCLAAPFSLRFFHTSRSRVGPIAIGQQ